MDLAIDKQSLVNTILYGYGTPLNGPRPKDIEPITNKEESIEEAKAMLDKAGYIVGDDGTREKISSDKKTTERLAFSISTADISELKDAAFQIRDDLSLIGISVDVRNSKSNNHKRQRLREFAFRRTNNKRPRPLCVLAFISEAFSRTKCFDVYKYKCRLST